MHSTLTAQGGGANQGGASPACDNTAAPLRHATHEGTPTAAAAGQLNTHPHSSTAAAAAGSPPPHGRARKRARQTGAGPPHACDAAAQHGGKVVQTGAARRQQPQQQPLQQAAPEVSESSVVQPSCAPVPDQAKAEGGRQACAGESGRVRLSTNWWCSLCVCLIRRKQRGAAGMRR